MILNIREAFNELLEENAWMDKETRQVARAKVSLLRNIFALRLKNELLYLLINYKETHEWQ